MSKTQHQQPEPKPKPRQLKRQKQREAMYQPKPPLFPLPEQETYKPLG